MQTIALSVTQGQAEGDRLAWHLEAAVGRGGGLFEREAEAIAKGDSCRRGMGELPGAQGLVLHRPFQREARRLGENGAGALSRLQSVAELGETLDRKGRAGAV